MNGCQELSGVTAAYLERFDGIFGRMVSGMTGAVLTDSVSHNFIVQMIPHHRAAIEMSEDILRYTTCVPLEGIARRIIAQQTQSIADMRSVLPACGTLKSTPRQLADYQSCFARVTRAMFAQMRGACVTNDVTADFMRQMIPHHRGAIRMSENALDHPLCDGLYPILRAIIISQREGVRQMQRLLRCR